MIFYLVFTFIVNGTSLWIPLGPHPSLDECETEGKRILGEMQIAYPTDTTMMYRCQEVPQ